jgi:hypothetical protein
VVFIFHCYPDFNNLDNPTHVKIRLILKEGHRRHSEKCLNIERRINDPNLQLDLNDKGNRRYKCDLGNCMQSYLNNTKSRNPFIYTNFRNHLRTSHNGEL